MKKAKQKRLLKRCSEILACLIIDKQTSALLDEIVLKGKEVPLELKIKKENVLNIQELEKMKPKFHLGALLYLRDKDIFSGNALDAAESTIHRLKAKDVVVALEDDDAEDIDDNDNNDDDNNDEDDNDEDNNVAGDKAADDDDIDNDVGD